MAYRIFQDRVVRGTVGDPFAAINDALINPLTKMQSGLPGSLRFPSDFVNVAIETRANDFGNLVKGVGFSMGDLRIDHLASVVAPVELVSPTTQASTLWNDLMMSPGSAEAIELSIALRLAIDGEDSPLTMDDEIDFKIKLDTMALTGKIQALIQSSKFLRMPFGHVFNIDCWLATIDSPDGLSVFSTYASFVGMDIDANCVSCSEGLGLLPTMLGIFRSAGAVQLLGSRLSSLTKSVVEGTDPLHTMLNRMLSEAQYSCPVSPQYDPDFVKPDYPPLGLPALTSTDLDTLLFATMLGKFSLG